MIISRAKLRWWFIVPSGVPMSYAYRSVGSEFGGMWVVSLYTVAVPGCTEDFGYDDTLRLRGRRQVVIALSVPCNPSCLGIV